MLETLVWWSDSFSHEALGLCCQRQWGGTAHLPASVTAVGCILQLLLGLSSRGGPHPLRLNELGR